MDIAVYSITHDAIVAALVRAHQRGVEVRVLTDKVQASSKYAQDEALEAAGISLRRDTQTGSLHHKFTVGDGSAVMTGSFNWTESADQRNAENFVIVRIRYVVRSFEAEFERLWALNAGPLVSL